MTYDFLFYRVRDWIAEAGFTTAAETLHARWDWYSSVEKQAIATAWAARSAKVRP